MRDYDAAIEAYRSAIRRRYYTAYAHYYLGRSYFNKGMIEDAKTAYREALRVDPLYEPAKESLQRLTNS